jgi:hypothetical protein
MPAQTVMKPDWRDAARSFVDRLHDPSSGGYRSVLGGPVTLYGTCYGLLARYYLGADDHPTEQTRNFLRRCQEPSTGLMVGPELQEWSPPANAAHDREHLLYHLTCAALPTCRQFGVPLDSPIREARRFCDLDYLRAWLDRRNLKAAWLEGNNLLFPGQLLVYLRDAEGVRAAGPALALWFEWLDQRVDPATGLWGLAEGASRLEAMCGGYHQLLGLLPRTSPHRPPPQPRGYRLVAAASRRRVCT